MSTTTETLREAIRESIKQDGFVEIEVPNVEAALDELKAMADEFESAEQEPGMVDCWGVLNVSDFRLRIVSAQ